MKGTKKLLENEDRWVTNMGLSFPGERVVFRGKDLFYELSNLGWMELLLYGITGRRFNRDQIILFEGIWTLCTSYPDPRLWNNRIATLAGTVRSTGTLGISAAIAVSEATIYGGRPVIGSIDFLIRIDRKLKEGLKLDCLVCEELKKYRSIPGYGRPIVRIDERIKPLMNLANDLGYSEGAYVKLAFQVEKFLIEKRYRLYMNVASLIAALAADQGFTQQEYYRYMILCFTAGMFPCYIDAVNKPEGTFFPLRCSRVTYEGKLRRAWM